MRELLTQTSVLDVERSLVVKDGVEKVVAVELRVVVTRIAAAKRVSLSSNGELTGHGRGPRGTERADQLINEYPAAA